MGALLIAGALSTAGAQLPQGDGLLYYELGAAGPIAPPASTETASNLRPAAADWNRGLNCGAFDPLASAANQLNGLTDGFSDMMGSVLESATAAVAALPGMILQRANPGLYDLMQNGVLQAKQDFAQAQSACQAVRRESALQSAGSAWRALAAAHQWREASATEPDLIAAERDTEAAGGELGIPWLCDARAGGVGQPAIAVTGDTVLAGYNGLLNRAACDASAPTVVGSIERPLITRWPSPAAAVRFGVRVLGETAIQTCEACERVQSTPGQGLAVIHAERQAAVQTQLAELVAADRPPTIEELTAVSAPPSLWITRPLIEAIRLDDQPAVLLARLAGEVALAETVDHALLLRRLLQAGRQSPNIAANSVAQQAIAMRHAELTTEIDNLLYEIEVRTAIASNTPRKLLLRKLQRDLASPQEVLLPREPPFVDGAIQR